METKKIPTAEEFLTLKGDKDFRLSMSGLNVSEIMIEFAKLHVQQALKEASENVTVSKNKGQIIAREFGNVLDGNYSVNEQSILNSYPLDNIK